MNVKATLEELMSDEKQRQQRIMEYRIETGKETHANFPKTIYKQMTNKPSGVTIDPEQAVHLRFPNPMNTLPATFFLPKESGNLLAAYMYNKPFISLSKESLRLYRRKYGTAGGNINFVWRGKTFCIQTAAELDAVGSGSKQASAKDDDDVGGLGLGGAGGRPRSGRTRPRSGKNLGDHESKRKIQELVDEVLTQYKANMTVLNNSVSEAMKREFQKELEEAISNASRSAIDELKEFGEANMELAQAEREIHGYVDPIGSSVLGSRNVGGGLPSGGLAPIGSNRIGGPYDEALLAPQSVLDSANDAAGARPTGAAYDQSNHNPMGLGWGPVPALPHPKPTGTGMQASASLGSQLHGGGNKSNGAAGSKFKNRRIEDIVGEVVDIVAADPLTETAMDRKHAQAVATNGNSAGYPVKRDQGGAQLTQMQPKSNLSSRLQANIAAAGGMHVGPGDNGQGGVGVVSGKPGKALNGLQNAIAGMTHLIRPDSRISNGPAGAHSGVDDVIQGNREEILRKQEMEMQQMLAQSHNGMMNSVKNNDLQRAKMLNQRASKRNRMQKAERAMAVQQQYDAEMGAQR